MIRRERFGGPRRHGATVPLDRRELEASGWRTTLEYRENHVRGRDGRLRQLRVVWYAEAERDCAGSEPLVVVAEAVTAERAWSRLRAAADVAEVHPHRRPPRLPDPVAVHPRRRLPAEA